MKVLVTGARGFIGSHLVEHLANRGQSVRVLDHRPGTEAFPFTSHVEVVEGDIRDYKAVAKAVRGCEIVYHVAGITHLQARPKKDYFDVNVGGTNNIARASIEHDLRRLVYCSSVGVHGPLKNLPADERTPLKPDTPYRESKLKAEQTVLKYHREDQLPVVIARPGSVIGPRGLNWLGLCQAISSGSFRIIGKGQNHVHLGFVSDMVDGLRRCGETPGVDGEAYILVGKKPIQLDTMVDLIARELGVGTSRFRTPEVPFRAFQGLASFVYQQLGFEIPRIHNYELFVCDRVFDISKAENELGYAPKIGADEAVRQTIAWYREQGQLQL